MRSDEFLIAEYHEAATSYANGVTIGFNTSRNFVVANTVLLALHNTPEIVLSTSDTIRHITSVTPFIGVFICLILAIMLPTYYKHLNNCRDRCAELEKHFGGKLFSKNQKIGEKKFNTQTVLVLLSILFACLWAYVWIMANIYTGR